MRVNRGLVVLPLLLAGCSHLQEAPRPAPSSTGEVPPASSPVVSALLIPPEDFPPPGKCRVWIPGQASGHQPESTSCPDARQAAPRGAWVIHRPGKKSPLEVSFMDRERSGIVADVRRYDPESGVLLRETAVSKKN